MKKVLALSLALVMMLGVICAFSGCNKKEENTSVTVDKVEDLANLKIGVQAGSAALDALKNHEAYSTYQNNILEYGDYNNVITALTQGLVDVIVIDQVVGEYKNSQLEKDKKMKVCNFDFGDDFYAVGCRKGETAVSAKINEAIKTLIDNGKAAEISNKWFGKDLVIFEDYDKEIAVENTEAWDYIVKKGKLIVGLDNQFPPMGFVENGELVGFDIDLANAVGEILGVEVEFRPIDWDAKELELNSKNVDCLWNGMSATPGRQESMALTNKYLNNKMVIMAAQ